MNHYGQMLLEFNRLHRPEAYAQIANPKEYFEEAGELVAQDVASIRDQILRRQTPDEDVEAYRLRSYQALRTAEELVLADHSLMVPEPQARLSATPSDNPALAEYYRDLADIDEAVLDAHSLLTTDES